MRWIVCLSASLYWVCVPPAARAVDPIPESQQAPLAQKILDAYHGKHPAATPRTLQVVYFTPADRDPEPRYRERLEAILEDIRAFYRAGMERAGFGPMTFDLARDVEGRLLIHVVKGRRLERDYQKPDGEIIITECQPALAAAGISFESETVLVFCNLADWDATTKTFSHHSPYYGLGYGGEQNQNRGLCFALDSAIQNLADLTKLEPILDDDEYGRLSPGKFNTIFIGAIAHEMGHAFGLPHCGERRDERSLGTSLLGTGNHTYREELRGDGPGTFLTLASAMRLAARPLFCKSEKEMTLAPQLQTNEFQLSTNLTRHDLAGRPGALRVEGVVRGTPPVYGVIAYFDSLRDGGYHAPTATAVPDAAGRFALEITDLSPTRNGELRLEYCHANGSLSESRAAFSVTLHQAVDLEQWKVAKVLEPMSRAVLREDVKLARAELRQLEDGRAPELARRVARKLLATLNHEPKPVPANASAAIAELPLGDARAKTAEVGWLTPTANRIPANDQVETPLLESEKIYATGLYAHAPSRYVFDLGGKWTRLRGEAGLHVTQQPYGSVVFSIKADGREVFRSGTIQKSVTTRYDINVTDVTLLELIVDDAGDGNHNDWGLWLDPTLLR